MGKSRERNILRQDKIPCLAKTLVFLIKTTSKPFVPPFSIDKTLSHSIFVGVKLDL